MAPPILLALLAVARADVYLHTPRGSNNRLDEENRDRNNDQRLMDTQNNNRGGANVGQMYYYAGSTVPVEWSAQHSCGNPNNNCELIIQVMCEDRVRDGTTTETIPIDPNRCYNFNCDTDVRFGRHESFLYYQNCTLRSRNLGLFTSTQKLQGKSARYTRQNPTGTRFGYECPEERDYYPYWGPSPWRDVAVLTNQEDRCAAYQAESQNVKSRFWCKVPKEFFKYRGYQEGIIPITKRECESMEYTDKNQTTFKNVSQWVEQPGWGIPPPVCLGNVWSRDNHHGNVQGGYWANWNWTVPTPSALKLGVTEDPDRCVLRLRYNISTGDLPHFDGATVLASASLDSDNSGLGDDGKGKTKPARFAIWETYGLDNTSGLKREYVLKNNPKVDIFGALLPPTSATDSTPRVQLQLAVNTAQYGRTFEDRTHRFAIRVAAGDLVGKRIHNINVRGKRGNIVQTYPGTEYDFVPDRVICAVGEYVHFQWTGSNTNPNTNAGQGREGSDRHNVVVQRGINYPEWGQTAFDSPDNTFGHLGNSYPNTIGAEFLGLSAQDKQFLAYLDVPGGQFGGEMSELDDAGTYFDLGPRRCGTVGVYHYLCTRNNNFSNRSQKGTIRVQANSLLAVMLSKLGGTISTPTGLCPGCSVTVAPGVLSGPTTIVVEYLPSDSTPNTLCSGGACTSPIVSVSTAGVQAAPAVTVTVSYAVSGTRFANLYQGTGVNSEWQKMDSTCTGGVCTATSSGSATTFAVKSHIAAEVIVPVTIVVVILLGVCAFLAYRKWKQTKK